MIAWHGTIFPRVEFQDFRNHRDFISFALDRDHARSYAVGVRSESWRETSRIFEVDLSISCPLDYRCLEHRIIIKDYLEEIGFTHFPKEMWEDCIGNRGAWQCLEHRELIIRNGFDAVFTCESGWRNIHVLNQNLIRIVQIYKDDPGSLGYADSNGYRITSDCNA